MSQPRATHALLLLLLLRLCARPTHMQDIAAAKPAMLPAVNRALDSQLASFGIHPGRTGLSDLELLAAMKMLG
jgi:hypothetical protein